MQYYFAPMEGLTDQSYRRLHHRFFPGIDRYYTPFFSPTMHHSLTGKEARELPPAAENPAQTVPQILTKSAPDFLWLTRLCADRGYGEVNLNAGCPSGTVAAKGKGAGMLADLDSFARFLDEIYSKSALPVSIKTRIGIASAEEFPAILELYNRYPVKELTVHCRVRKAFYAGSADMAAWEYALANSRNPLCYNGDIASAEDAARLERAYPQLKAVMIGRALIGKPDMLCKEKADGRALLAFYEELLAQYVHTFGGSRNAMFRLKEHWHYLLPQFAGSEALGKRLRKTTDLEEYRAITREIFFLPRV